MLFKIFVFYTFLKLSDGLFGIHLRPAQSVVVRGRLMCMGRPAYNVLVKLYDEDDLSLDDLMAESRSDAFGRFFMAGTEHEFGTIDPKLNIYHDCNDILPCQRRLTYKIPPYFITSGYVAETVFDLGTLELGANFRNEERDCFHR